MILGELAVFPAFVAVSFFEQDKKTVNTKIIKVKKASEIFLIPLYLLMTIGLDIFSKPLSLDCDFNFSLMNIIISGLFRGYNLYGTGRY